MARETNARVEAYWAEQLALSGRSRRSWERILIVR